MYKLFPKMTDCPEGKQIAMGGLYWVVYQILLPFLLAIITAAGAGDEAWIIYTPIAFYVINAVFVTLIFRTYLADSFWNLRMNKTHCLKTIGTGLGLLAILEIPAFILGKGFTSFGPWFGEFTALPVVDTFSGLPPLLWLTVSPVLMTICIVVAVPVTMCCLYYAVGFAPACQNRPWLAYLIVAVIGMIPMVFLVTAYGREIPDVVGYYLCLLPFHFCACWVYQKCDTIWGPIIFHGTVNLVSILYYLYALTHISVSVTG